MPPRFPSTVFNPLGWFLRWASNSPRSWALFGACLLGTLAQVGLTPRRWIEGETLAEDALRAWLPWWVLAGTCVGWIACDQVRGLLARLEPTQSVLLKALWIGCGVGLGLVAWGVGCMAFVPTGSRWALLSEGLLALVVVLGPSLVLTAWMQGLSLLLAGALLQISLREVWPPMEPGPTAWGAAALLCAGCLLLGLSSDSKRAQPL